jgi:hypothetical protein
MHGSRVFVPMLIAAARRQQGEGVAGKLQHMSFVSNPQIDLAFEYVRNTGKNIFLTGKAGTGKTTFLQQIKEESSKRMIATPPTVWPRSTLGHDVAFVFQLPLGLHLPGTSREVNSQRRFSREQSPIASHP